MPHERRHALASAFTLLEVIVAMTMVSVVIVGVATVYSFSIKTAAHAENLLGAVDLAQSQLELATAVTRDAMENRSETSGRYTCTCSYQESSEGLMLANIEVTWTEQGDEQRFRLARVFAPREPGSGESSEGQ